jgi:hypothetical protein
VDLFGALMSLALGKAGRSAGGSFNRSFDSRLSKLRPMLLDLDHGFGMQPLGLDRTESAPKPPRRASPERPPSSTKSGDENFSTNKTPISDPDMS